MNQAVGTPDAVPVEDAVSFKELKKQPLYAARVPIHPKAVHGLFRRIKWAALIGLLALYYAAPWLRWDRGPGVPDQALLIDMPGRRAYFFWIEIWPGLVRVHLPADRLDRPLHVGGAPDRG